MDLLHSELLPYVLAAVFVGAIVCFLLFRPRQRVRLNDSAPLRPHMVARNPADAPISDGRLEVADHAENDEGADDFTRMKGVGPKFAELLRSHGYFRFAQLADLDQDQLSRLDDELGAFKGRLTRDRVADQARFLGRNDLAGFEKEFGKL